MTAHTQVPLGEICKINPRAKRNGYASDTLVSSVPMAAVDERLGAITTREKRPIADVSKSYTPFQDGDVLFAKMTPCMENGKAALAQDLTNGMGSGSTEFYVLRPDEKVLGEYIYHFVRQPQFRETAKRNFTGTAGQQRVPKSFMENVLIPLPPLDEQRRIVGILNRAAKIERLRAQAQELMREFIPALFVRMFGDPIENPMGWEVRPLGECCILAQYGTRKKANDRSEGLPVLRVGNVTYRGDLDCTDLKWVALPESDIEKYALRAGDILFNRTNSTELVGKTGIWDGRFSAVAASYFIRLRLAETRVCTTYVWAFMNSSAMKQRLFEAARGVIGQANINVKRSKVAAVAHAAVLPPKAVCGSGRIDPVDSDNFRVRLSGCFRTKEVPDVPIVGRRRMTDIVDSQRRSEMMAGIRGRDTAPELAVPRIAHRMGLRFRLHRKDLPGRPDLVLPKHRLAVFVRGCFWHRHEGCRYASTPKSRVAFWTAKFEANVVRDARQQAALRALGWQVLVIWQCETRYKKGIIYLSAEGIKSANYQAIIRFHISSEFPLKLCGVSW